MKLLVFAHIPPPHHGQSYMVKLMIDGFGGDCRELPAAERERLPVQCFHVNARVSDSIEDVGAFRLGKLLLVLRYCIQAIWYRFRYGARTFYYVPAPGKRAALYRDWIVMLLCRPFFSHLIHHWHAVGLGDWLKKEAHWTERWLTHLLLGRPTLGVALAIPSMRDSLWFRSDQVEVVANGIPDPCPNFEDSVYPKRRGRLAARKLLVAGQMLSSDNRRSLDSDPAIFRVLFLANLLRDKGIFDALEAIVLSNNSLQKSGSPIRMHLTVAGALPSGDNEASFLKELQRPELESMVEWIGFADQHRKEALLRESDCLCFPSYYHAESFGLVVVEAMAAGMPVVTTRWRALPELLPPGYVGIVPPRRADLVAAALINALTEDATDLRARFLAHFEKRAHLERLREAIAQVEFPFKSYAIQ